MGIHSVCVPQSTNKFIVMESFISISDDTPVEEQLEGECISVEEEMEPEDEVQEEEMIAFEYTNSNVQHTPQINMLHKAPSVVKAPTRPTPVVPPKQTPKVKWSDVPRAMPRVPVPILPKVAPSSVEISTDRIQMKDSQLKSAVGIPTPLQSSTSATGSARRTILTGTTPLRPISSARPTASPVTKQPPLVIRDIRQCKAFHTDSLENLKLKLDYVDRMLKTQQTLLGKLRGRSLFLSKDNYRLKKSIAAHKAVLTEHNLSAAADDKYVLVFNEGQDACGEAESMPFNVEHVTEN